MQGFARVARKEEMYPLLKISIRLIPKAQEYASHSHLSERLLDKLSRKV